MAVKDVELSKCLQEIADQLKEISSSIQSLADEMSGRQAAHEAGKGNFEEQLKENLQCVDLSVSQNELKIRPRSFLRTEVFKAVADVSRKHGGRWDEGQRFL